MAFPFGRRAEAFDTRVAKLGGRVTRWFLIARIEQLYVVARAWLHGRLITPFAKCFPLDKRARDRAPHRAGLEQWNPCQARPKIGVGPHA